MNLADLDLWEVADLINEDLALWEFRDVRLRLNEETAWQRLGRRDFIRAVLGSLERLQVEQ